MQNGFITKHDIAVHTPADNTDEAYIQIDGTRFHFDAFDAEGRGHAFDALAELRRQLNLLEAHLRCLYRGEGPRKPRTQERDRGESGEILQTAG